MNKRQKQIIERHRRSECYYLHHCYTSYSMRKGYAYDKCKERASAQRGYDFKIISYNSNMFSVGWYFAKNDKTYFHYETNKSLEEWEVK